MLSPPIVPRRGHIRPEASKILVVLLKGAALATALYPSIALRPLGDIDLLVPEEHLAEAVARLKALGYVEPHPDMAPGLNALTGHHVHLQGGQHAPVAVEVHWTLIGGAQDWRSPSLPWFWEQTEEWSGGAGEYGSRGAREHGGKGAREQGSSAPPHASPSAQKALPHLCTPTPPHPRTSHPLTLTPTAHLLYLCAHLMLQPCIEPVEIMGRRGPPCGGSMTFT